MRERSAHRESDRQSLFGPRKTGLSQMPIQSLAILAINRSQVRHHATPAIQPEVLDAPVLVLGAMMRMAHEIMERAKGDVHDVGSERGCVSRSHVTRH
ncbi:hypothetical protein LIA77_06337 [Sarocladium implicatum]|nr:hypothetical protein LIA77_06337 [Sarocladium implicatum]